MVGTIICEVGTNIIHYGTINVIFYLLEVRYPHEYCRITRISYRSKASVVFTFCQKLLQLISLANQPYWVLFGELDFRWEKIILVKKSLQIDIIINKYDYHIINKFLIIIVLCLKIDTSVCKTSILSENITFLIFSIHCFEQMSIFKKNGHIITIRCENYKMR